MRSALLAALSSFALALVACVGAQVLDLGGEGGQATPPVPRTEAGVDAAVDSGTEAAAATAADSSTEAGGGTPADSGTDVIFGVVPDASAVLPAFTTLPNTCALDAGTPGATGWIVFDSDSVELVRHIFAVHADDCAVMQITSGTSIEQEPAVSPDGTTLVFSSSRTADGTFQLYTMDFASRVLRQLTAQTGGAGQPVFSPDGQSIAYHSGVEVYLMAADGSGAGLNYEHPAFAPDGNGLVVDETLEIDAFDLQGQNKRYVVANGTQEAFYPAPSPDGVSMAFVAGCGSSIGAQSVMVTTFATTLSNPCTTQQWNQPDFGNISHPSWGSDAWIAFAHQDTSGLNHVAVSNDNGQVFDMVEDDGDQRDPLWAPSAFTPN